MRLFCSQFEPDGDGFLYRAGLRAEAVRVSAQERQAFVDAYGRQLRRMMALLIGGIVLVLIAMTAWDARYEAIDRNSVTYWAILSSPTVLFLLLHHYFWHAPARALEGRPRFGGTRPRKEIRDRILTEQSYSRYIFTLVLFSLILWGFLSKPDAFQGWNIAWIAFFGAVVIMGAFNLIRKWTISRRR